MEAEVQRLLDALAELRRKANVNACFGEPVTVEGRTVIPVAQIGYGFCMGLGQGPTTEAEEGADKRVGTGGGGGVGMAASPVGVIEVTPEGTHIEPVIDKRMMAIARTAVVLWSAFWVARTLRVIFGRDE